MPKIRTNKDIDVDLDTYWKTSLDWIEPAILFFLPELHAKVDWSEEYRSMEQELRSLIPQKKGQMRRTDKLFKLKLLDGTEQFVLLHVEAEQTPDKKFPFRMFDYTLRLLLRYNHTPVVALAIFVGNKPAQPFNWYRVETYGHIIHFQFNTYCVADQEEEQLLQADNPSALLVLANLYLIQSKNDLALRFRLKRKIMQIILDRRIDFDKFKEMLNFLVYLIRLPKEDE